MQNTKLEADLNSYTKNLASLTHRLELLPVNEMTDYEDKLHDLQVYSSIYKLEGVEFDKRVGSGLLQDQRGYWQI